MGKRGPRPTPTAIKRRRGSCKIQEQATKVAQEPKPTRVNRPKAPKDLTADAKKAWKNLIELLDGMGVLTEADLRISERYLETWVVWRRNLDFIAEKGDVYPIKKWNPHTVVSTEDGKVKRGAYEVVGFREFPHVRIVARFANLLVNMERELGLTPSARTRIAVENSPPRGVGRPPGVASDRSVEPYDVRQGPRLKVVKGGA